MCVSVCLEAQKVCRLTLEIVANEPPPNESRGETSPPMCQVHKNSIRLTIREENVVDDGRCLLNRFARVNVQQHKDGRKGTNWTVDGRDHPQGSPK